MVSNPSLYLHRASPRAVIQHRADRQRPVGRGRELGAGGLGGRKRDRRDQRNLEQGAAQAGHRGPPFSSLQPHQPEIAYRLIIIGLGKAIFTWNLDFLRDGRHTPHSRHLRLRPRRGRAAAVASRLEIRCAETAGRLRRSATRPNANLPPRPGSGPLVAGRGLIPRALELDPSRSPARPPNDSMLGVAGRRGSHRSNTSMGSRSGMGESPARADGIKAVCVRRPKSSHLVVARAIMPNRGTGSVAWRESIGKWRVLPLVFLVEIT